MDHAATLLPGNSQHYLHDTEQPALATKKRATGGEKEAEEERCLAA